MRMEVRGAIHDCQEVSDLGMSSKHPALTGYDTRDRIATSQEV